jgi:uncharacterized protein
VPSGGKLTDGPTEVSFVRVNVSDVMQETGNHKTVPLSIQLDSFDLAGQVIEFEGLFTGSAEIWNAGDRLLVQFAISGTAIAPCSRCLNPVHLPLDLSFEEEYVEGQEDDGLGEDEELAEVRTVTYFKGDELDLTDSLRENVLLEVPMKVLCSEGCLGLCPTCGTNLNESTCSCAEAPTNVDPRLAIFKDLLRKPDSNS